VSAVPLAWVLGRGGCAVAHDHPGIPNNMWFGVRYPDVGRCDLGLYEMVLLIPLALAFLWLRRKPRPWGFYCALACISYAPVRFCLDFLRVTDPIYDTSGLKAAPDARYWSLTPAQWACLAMSFTRDSAFTQRNPSTRELGASATHAV
jgi:phosphatidylglycerol:prolipoprotein diacylglycerol transferase